MSEQGVGMEAMVAISGLTKDFGAIRAVDDDLVRGPPRRGAGLPRPQRRRQVDDDEDDHGFLAPSAGRAVVCGHDVVDHPVGAKR